LNRTANSAKQKHGLHPSDELCPKGAFKKRSWKFEKWLGRKEGRCSASTCMWGEAELGKKKWEEDREQSGLNGEWPVKIKEQAYKQMSQVRLDLLMWDSVHLTTCGWFPKRPCALLTKDSSGHRAEAFLVEDLLI
jgi:hypothetical protein